MLFIAVPLLDYLRDPEVQAKIETAVEVSRGWSSDDTSLTRINIRLK